MLRKFAIPMFFLVAFAFVSSASVFAQEEKNSSTADETAVEYIETGSGNSGNGCPCSDTPNITNDYSCATVSACCSSNFCCVDNGNCCGKGWKGQKRFGCWKQRSARNWLSPCAPICAPCPPVCVPVCNPCPPICPPVCAPVCNPCPPICFDSNPCGDPCYRGHKGHHARKMERRALRLAGYWF